jgi:dolichol-phosphate mannosyltransferase
MSSFYTDSVTVADREPPSSSELLLTIIIPVYNEVNTISELLSRVLAVPYAKQVIVVDDGSSDGTAAYMEKWIKKGDILLLHHAFNRGKGAAIRTGLARACGRFTLIQDADLEYDVNDYAYLLEPLLTGQAQVVYGSRYLRAGTGMRSAFWCRWGVKLLNLAVRFLYGVRLTDEATCYKIFPTTVLRKMDLQCRRFEFCPEVTAKTCRMGIKIVEVPIHYRPRSVAAGKKIRWTDGLQALTTLWKWRKWSPLALPAAPSPLGQYTPTSS